MGMTIEEFIKRFNDNANHELTLGNLQGCLEFRQIAEWLEQLQKIEQIVEHWINEDEVGMSDYWMGQIRKVLEDE